MDKTSFKDIDRRSLVMAGSILVFVLFTIVWSVNTAMHYMLRQDAFTNGMEWARFIERRLEINPELEKSQALKQSVQNLLTTNQHAGASEDMFDDIFDLGKIYHVDIFDYVGNRLVHYGAYDPDRRKQAAHHHTSGLHAAHTEPAAHGDHADHADHADHVATKTAPVALVQTHADGPASEQNAGHEHGMQVVKSGFSAAPHQKGVPVSADLIAAIAENRYHRISLIDGASDHHPILRAEVFHPVAVGADTLGVIRVLVDLTDRKAYYQNILGLGSIVVLLIAWLAIAVPYLIWRKGILEKKRADEKAHFLASHDCLTGLANRRQFYEVVKSHWSRKANSRKSACAIHYIDVDHFKETNDTLGHDVGDMLLSAIASRLNSVCGKDDVLARIGGDEFAILQRNLGDENAATNLAEEIVAVFQAPFFIKNMQMVSTVSVGFAVSGIHGDSFDDITKHADIALYSVKRDGRNGSAGFSAGMWDELAEKSRVERLLHEAISGEGFELHFQPQHRASDLEISGLEALLRLRDENGDLVSPEVFIPIAEQSNLIHQVGEWVVQKGIHTAAQWPDHIKLAINVSTKEFSNPYLVDTLEDALNHTGIDPARIEIEITESLMLEFNEQNQRTLDAIKALGISVVMDDFGTGYSSLSSLWNFQFDKVKIDRSFVQAYSRKEQRVEDVIRTIKSLGRAMNISVTAEGVETVEQLAVLQEIGVDELQGFYFAKPMTERDVSAALAGLPSVKSHEHGRLKLAQAIPA